MTRLQICAEWENVIFYVFVVLLNWYSLCRGGGKNYNMCEIFVLSPVRNVRISSLGGSDSGLAIFHLCQSLQ